MSTWTSFVRMYGNFLRSSSYTYQELAAAYLPRLHQQKGRFLEKVKAGRDRVMANEVARKLHTAYLYAKVEMAPPSKDEIAQMKTGIGQIKTFFKGNGWKEMTVREAWLLILVTVEIGLWFFIGECIGKMRLVGYNP